VYRISSVPSCAGHDGSVETVLEGSHTHLGLVQAFGPLVHGARPRDKYEVRTGERQGSHVVGKMAAIADGDADVPGARLVTESALGINRSQATNLELAS
jgi:hypothetical protein